MAYGHRLAELRRISNDHDTTAVRITASKRSSPIGCPDDARHHEPVGETDPLAVRERRLDAADLVAVVGTSWIGAGSSSRSTARRSSRARRRPGRPPRRMARRTAHHVSMRTTMRINICTIVITCAENELVLPGRPAAGTCEKAIPGSGHTGLRYLVRAAAGRLAPRHVRRAGRQADWAYPGMYDVSPRTCELILHLSGLLGRLR